MVLVLPEAAFELVASGAEEPKPDPDSDMSKKRAFRRKVFRFSGWWRDKLDDLECRDQNIQGHMRGLCLQGSKRTNEDRDRGSGEKE